MNLMVKSLGGFPFLALLWVTAHSAPTEAKGPEQGPKPARKRALDEIADRMEILEKKLCDAEKSVKALMIQAKPSILKLLADKEEVLDGIDQCILAESTLSERFVQRISVLEAKIQESLNKKEPPWKAQNFKASKEAATMILRVIDPIHKKLAELRTDAQKEYAKLEFILRLLMKDTVADGVEELGKAGRVNETIERLEQIMADTKKVVQTLRALADNAGKAAISAKQAEEEAGKAIDVPKPIRVRPTTTP